MRQLILKLHKLLLTLRETPEMRDYSNIPKTEVVYNKIRVIIQWNIHFTRALIKEKQ